MFRHSGPIATQLIVTLRLRALTKAGPGGTPHGEQYREKYITRYKSNIVEMCIYEQRSIDGVEANEEGTDEQILPSRRYPFRSRDLSCYYEIADPEERKTNCCCCEDRKAESLSFQIQFRCK